MKKMLTLTLGALVALTSLGLVSGCSSEPDPEFGTISSKEYDAGGTERKCRTRNGKRRCTNTTSTVEWELKLTFDGKSFEDEVSQAQFDAVAEGECWSTQANEVVDAAKCAA